MDNILVLIEELIRMKGNKFLQCENEGAFDISTNLDKKYTQLFFKVGAQ